MVKSSCDINFGSLQYKTTVRTEWLLIHAVLLRYEEDHVLGSRVMSFFTSSFVYI